MLGAKSNYITVSLVQSQLPYCHYYGNHTSLITSSNLNKYNSKLPNSYILNYFTNDSVQISANANPLVTIYHIKLLDLNNMKPPKS